MSGVDNEIIIDDAYVNNMLFLQAAEEAQVAEEEERRVVDPYHLNSEDVEEPIDEDDIPDGAIASYDRSGYDQANGRPNSAQRRREASEILARRNGIESDDEAALSSLLGPNETAMDVLERTSFTFKHRRESCEYLEKQLAGLAPGTEQYEAKKLAAQITLCKKVYKAFDDGSCDKTMAESFRLSRDWLKEQEEHFPLFRNEYSNLSPFGNMMMQVLTDFEVIANPGQNMEILLLLRIASLACPRFNLTQSLMMLIAGDPSAGKSYLMQMIADALPKGYTLSMTSLTEKALSNDENEDHKCLMIEEMPPTLIQETFERTGFDGGASFIKALLTNKICTTRSLAYEKGKRQKFVHVTSKQWTGIFATNGTLVHDSPLLKRYFVLKPTFDADIALKINKLKATSAAPERLIALHRQRILADYIQKTEMLIGCAVLDEVNMDQFTIDWNRVVEEMALEGHPINDAKSVNMVGEVVKTLVVMRAVVEAVMMEANVDLRYDFERHCAKRFNDHCIEHFMNINRRLVAQTPEIVFGIFLCRTLFGNDTEGKIIDAAKKIFGMQVVGSYLQFPKQIVALPERAVSDGATGERKLEYSWHYLQFVTATSGAKEEVITQLLEHSTERPARNHISTAFDAMAKKYMTHAAYEHSDLVSGHVMLQENASKPEMRNPIIIKKYVPENYEETLLYPDGKNKQKASTRYYINVGALVKYKSQTTAMLSAIKKLQHAHTVKMRHLLSMPLEAPRYVSKADDANVNVHCASNASFFSLFAYVDFAPTPTNIMLHRSRHTLTEPQQASLSRSRAFLGGDSRLAMLDGSELSRRGRLAVQRSIALQSPAAIVTSDTDYDFFMKRQADCGADLDGVEILHWSNYADFCRLTAQRLPGLFTALPIDREYPKYPLSFLQKRFMAIDGAIGEGSFDEKRAVLPSVNTLISSGLQKCIPPQPISIDRAFANGGIEYVRDLFVKRPPAHDDVFQLDRQSEYALGEDGRNSETWRTASTIFNCYRNGEVVAKQFLELSGLKATIEPHAIDVRKRTVVLTPCAAPDRTTFQPRTVLNMHKRRLEEIGAGGGVAAAAIAARAFDADADPDDKEPGGQMSLFDERAVMAPPAVGRVGGRDGMSRDSALITQLEAHAAKTKMQSVNELPLDSPNDDAQQAAKEARAVTFDTMLSQLANKNKRAKIVEERAIIGPPKPGSTETAVKTVYF